MVVGEQLLLLLLLLLVEYATILGRGVLLEHLLVGDSIHFRDFVKAGWCGKQLLLLLLLLLVLGDDELLLLLLLGSGGRGCSCGSLLLLELLLRLLELDLTVVQEVLLGGRVGTDQRVREIEQKLNDANVATLGRLDQHRAVVLELVERVGTVFQQEFHDVLMATGTGQ